ncbi:LGFP repeat-containing protein, partial [Mariniluteicoccus endophyticus]
MKPLQAVLRLGLGLGLALTAVTPALAAPTTTPTPSVSASATPSVSASATPSRTASATPGPSIATSPTPSVTVTRSATPTRVATPQASATPSVSATSPIGRRWTELGGAGSPLGVPLAAEVCGLRDGGCYQKFRGGSIYWSPASGAHPVWGLIMDAYASHVFERGPLGYPVGAEFCGLKNGGCGQRFERGYIYWSQASGAHP